MAEKMEPLEYNSENRSRQTIIAIRQHNFQQALKPPPWLERMESPFKWARVLKRMLTYYLMHRKLQDYKDQGAFYGFEKFAILLVIVLRRVLLLLQHEKDSEEESEADESQEESNIGGKEDDVENEDEGEEYFYELEEALAKCEETLKEMAANEGDVMYSRIGPVFHHVLQTTKAHILFLQKKMAESQELARNIQDVEEMPLQCKAGIEGLRVKFIMSMYQDYTVLLPLLSKAIELDPQFGYWHYLTGKVIRRLRREFNEEMVKEELEHFEKAVELERNPKFLVFLAQAYQEWATLLLFRKDRTPKNTIDDLHRKSVDLFRECWSLKNDSPPISRRVGNGMLKMKAGFVDKVVAKEALLKSLELSPRGPFLALGKYYYYHEMNDEKALEYFEKDAPSNLASQEIIRLNLLKDPNYDPHDVLKEWIEYDQGTLKQQSALCDCGWYYLMYKKDLETSVKYFWEVLKMDYKSFKVMEYRSYGFFIKNPINMVEILVNEILLLKEKNETLPLEERKDLKFLENFLEKVLEKHPDLRRISPKPNLLGELKMEVERAIAFMRRKRYGANYRRSEPSRRVEKPGNWRNNRPSDGGQGNDNYEPSRRQEGDNSRRYNNWQSSTNRGNNNRSDMRNSFSIGDDDRSNRGYNRDDCIRNSESQSASNWSSERNSEVREGSSDRNEINSRSSFNNRGRTNRQNNSNNSRFDVTITDWRSENRKQ